MQTHFLYRPHVHTDGKVFTPDLLVARAWAVIADGTVAPVPVDRVAPAVAVQQVGAEAHGIAAVAVIAAGEGPLLTVASLHGPGMATADLLHCLKPLSRMAWRLSEIEAHLDRLRLRAWHLNGADRTAATDEALVGSGADTALAAVAGWSDPLPADSLVLRPARVSESPAGPVTGFEVELEDSRLGRRLTLTYEIDILD